MVPNDENGVDSTVMTIVKMFPDDFLRDTARETEFITRKRKIDPIILFWVLTIWFGVRFLSTIRGLKEKYEVEVEFKRRKYKDKRSKVKRRFLLVCVFNSESGGYHTYLTNISVEMLSAEEIALLYGARWEIELVFKELKSYYRLDQIPSENPNIVKCLI